MRGPFFLLCATLECLTGSSDGGGDVATASFFSFLLVGLPAFGLDFRLGDLLDLLGEGDILAITSGEISFFITISSRFSMFSCSNFINSRCIF